MENFKRLQRYWEPLGYLAILFLAVILRLGLALVNREANDQHMDVVQWILTYNELPIQSSGDCWECFQPKLFYAVVAGVARGLNITNIEHQIISAQLINALLGMVMVGYAYLFIRNLPVEWRMSKFLAWGLVAINPGLLSINIQATNDTFAITFSFLAVFYAYNLLANQDNETGHSKRNWGYLSITCLFASLAILSKTNASVTAIAIFAAFLIKAIFQHYRKFYIYAALFLSATAALVIPNPLSQYIVNYKEFGTPVTLTINVDKQPLPRFFEKTETHRPGILSIQDGFFTFKLVDLLEEPQNSPSNKVYPSHRTSFWTLLYARTHFIHFNQWPPSWLTTSEIIRNLGRLLYLFALLPSLAQMLGFFDEFFRGLRSLRINFRLSRIAFLSNQAIFQDAGLLLALLIGYLSFQTIYALEYRIYTVIKSIFIFPAWPSLLYFYIIGLNLFHQPRLNRMTWLKHAIMFSSGVLLILYAMNNLALYFQLIR